MATLGEWYLKETRGQEGIDDYHYMLRTQRIGQAFYNALSSTDKTRINGTTVDPFYTDDNKSVTIAIEFLIDNF
jgi:hypothetical protein